MKHMVVQGTHSWFGQWAEAESATVPTNHGGVDVESVISNHDVAPS